MHTRRLFVGIPLSAPLKKRLRHETSHYSSWPLVPIAENNLHVTVLFLGFRNEADLPLLSEQIEVVSASIPTFEMRFDQITFSPNRDRANLIWLSGETNEELRLLRQGLEQGLGYTLPERKSFRPHVTLARVKRQAWRSLPEQPALEKSVNYVEPVGSIVLFESLAEDGKRRYQPLAEFPLA
jgi:RNA 2',3'-cyclic 3'-phosphodiesterase